MMAYPPTQFRHRNKDYLKACMLLLKSAKQRSTKILCAFKNVVPNTFPALLPDAKRSVRRRDDTNAIAHHKFVILFLHDYHEPAVIQFHLELEPRPGCPRSLGGRSGRPSGQRSSCGRQCSPPATADGTAHDSPDDRATDGARTGLLALDLDLGNLQDGFDPPAILGAFFQDR
jgi:hypothetical protein